MSPERSPRTQQLVSAYERERRRIAVSEADFRRDAFILVLTVAVAYYFTRGNNAWENVWLPLLSGIGGVAIFEVLRFAYRYVWTAPQGIHADQLTATARAERAWSQERDVVLNTANTAQQANATGDLPFFRFEDSAGAMLHSRSGNTPIIDASGQRHLISARFWALRIRIKNDPPRRSARSFATNVVANICFLTETSDIPHLQCVGRWVTEASASTHVGATRTDDHINIPGNGMPERLYVAIRPEGTSGTYAYAQENLHAYPDGSHPNFRLPDHLYRVRVVLSCSEAADQELWFRLTTDGPDDEPLRIVPLPAPS
jgi:hypothetical protein